jgi:integrase
VLAGGERSWTVLGGDHRPVGPAEEFLEYLRVQRVSPNTVKSYARALALWWQYLAAFGLAWDGVTLEAVGGFLAWLRTGDGPLVVSIERRPARFAESTIAARLQAVMSCYRYHQFNGVELGRDLVRLVHGGGGSYKPMLERLARRTGRRQAVIRVRRPGRAAPPLLTPGQIERICDACAAWDAESCRWRGCVRDRLLWALLAESGLRLGEALGLQHRGWMLSRRPGQTAQHHVTVRSRPAPGTSQTACNARQRRAVCLDGVPYSVLSHLCQPAFGGTFRGGAGPRSERRVRGPAGDRGARRRAAALALRSRSDSSAQ